MPNDFSLTSHICPNATAPRKEHTRRTSPKVEQALTSTSGSACE